MSRTLRTSSTDDPELFVCRWVHVLCAVAVMEARFVDVTRRSPVDLSGIPLQRFKLKCYYCKKRVKKASGCCVQCSHGRCPTAYHPTCAQAAGVLMQPDDWPFVVHVTCCRHKGPAQIERNKAAMHELTVGQKVICKHKNGRYYQCDVVQLSKETFYEVNFDDGSFSDNLFPEDIVNRDCSQLGPPPQGEVVQVRWTDGLVYGAKFVAAHVIQMYLHMPSLQTVQKHLRALCSARISNTFIYWVSSDQPQGPHNATQIEPPPPGQISPLSPWGQAIMARLKGQ
ncbi:PREDICTED: lysine-specific demethylase 4A isoform X2 [Cyprinodon variegatus]|uniref:lysine-specific demethylase 4A isoform X2 n=1 Tax=Cyprinodon variegatus TaxID=28743 RepID=UPI000742CA6D|nr:PREDICTED: lysine-specific demethylase 4A isoform X2 [Cyprinodon variegatus]